MLSQIFAQFNFKVNSVHLELNYQSILINFYIKEPTIVNNCNINLQQQHIYYSSQISSRQ